MVCGGGRVVGDDDVRIRREEVLRSKVGICYFGGYWANRFFQG